MAPQEFLRGRRCPYCARQLRNTKIRKTNEQWVKEVRSLVGDEYTFLEPYQGNYYSIKCCHNICGQVWKVTPANFLAGHRCRYCSGHYLNTKIVQQRIYALYGNNYTLQSPYQGEKRKIKVKHEKCGYSWWTNPTNFLQGKSHCPHCQESKGERVIEQDLKDLHIAYQAQHRFKDCIYKRALPFDFYLPEQKIAIEYDGKQHYQENFFFTKHDPFKERKLKDYIKNMYCKEHDLYMLRIRYDHKKPIEDIIKQRLQGISHNKTESK